MYADLHCHTTNSDGEMSLDEVPTAAREAGLQAVAVTDHDRTHPDLDSPVQEMDGVTVIHGLELRVDAPIGERVDLLGYGVDPTPDLEQEIERLQRDRADRAQRMIERVEDYLDIVLPIEGAAGMGRPNIARAVVDHPEAEYEYGQVFDEVIGHDCPCYVSRDATAFDEGVDLLSESCRVVGLAHPFRYDDPEAALDLCEHLDAVERYYSYGDDVDANSRLVDRAVNTFDLIRTGGSDAHDHTLGRAGLVEDEFEAFAMSVGVDESR